MNFAAKLIMSALLISASATAFGQINIKIPKVPKIKAPSTSGTEEPNRPSGGSQQSKAGPGSDCQLDGALLFLFNELNETTRYVADYAPQKRTALVKGAQPEWLLRSVSRKERDKWASEWLKTDCAKEKFGEAFAALSTAAAEKLPQFIPAASNFANRSTGEEKMMRNVLKNSSTLTINKIGLYHGAWQIDKNSLGIPTSRYKQGFIWARDSSDDHPYCHLYQVNIIQDYAGGGTYTASRARLINDTLFGCP